MLCLQHEYQYGIAPDFAVQNYYRRFSGLTLGAGTLSGSYSNEFYSFTSGLVHFAFINTEVYGDEAFVALQADGKTWKPDEAARKAMGTTQAEWLAYDLSRVKRSETPYVIVCGHRPPFKTPGPLSASGNKFAKEIIPVMSKYEVDLYLAGHEHTYLVFEASKFKEYDVPPIIISGSPGNNEFIREEAELKIKDFEWKTLIPKYGFGYLTATPESLKWQWGSAATDATHNPKSAMWRLEDEVTFPRRSSFATYTPEGKPVNPPGDLSKVWPSSSKNGTFGSRDAVCCSCPHAFHWSSLLSRAETGGSGGRDGSEDSPTTSNSSSSVAGPTPAPMSSAQTSFVFQTHAVGSVVLLAALSWVHL